MSGVVVAPENYRIVPVRASVLLTAIALTDVIDVAEVGKLIAVSIRCTTAFGGSPRGVIQVQIDGLAQETFALSDTSTNRWGDDMLSFKRGSFGSQVTGVQDVVILRFNTRYGISCRVGVDVTAAGTAGQVRVMVYRGVRI